jgi:pSer/pThr/pTyr-binding forkhead associated (FHA) protein
VIRLTAVLEVEGQSPRALTFESNARSIILGRDASSDFQLPLPTVSRHHARISESDHIYFVEDLGSSHGSKLNGKSLVAKDKKVLRNGDVIELTKAKITCAIDAEKVASEDPEEGSGKGAARAVQGILGRLGEVKEGSAYLRCLSGKHNGLQLTLVGARTEWSLGRSQDCELVLDDANVSRRHAVIRKDWSGYVIEDLGSKNGLVLNEQRVERSRRLKSEDEIQIGPIKLVFVDPDAYLLDALKAVPGFEVEDSLSDGGEAAPQDGVGVGPGEGGIDGEPLPADEPDELADLDPSLLEPPPKRQERLDWALLGAGVAVALLSGLGLWFVLG